MCWCERTCCLPYQHSHRSINTLFTSEHTIWTPRTRALYFVVNLTTCCSETSSPPVLLKQGATECQHTPSLLTIPILLPTARVLHPPPPRHPLGATSQTPSFNQFIFCYLIYAFTRTLVIYAFTHILHTYTHTNPPPSPCIPPCCCCCRPLQPELLPPLTPHTLTHRPGQQLSGAWGGHLHHSRQLPRTKC